MFRLFQIRPLSHTAAAIRQRTREQGVGLPDLRAPGALREVELSPELVDAASGLYEKLVSSRHEAEMRQGNGGNGGGTESSESEAETREEAEALARSEKRRLVSLSF
jgi:hypothetical protein